MGSVYKAYGTELHRHVALKVPHFGPEEGAKVLDRFKHEARAAATLRHTNLCQVYDVGAIDGINFLTMEFIEGQSLDGYVDRQRDRSGRLDPAMARGLPTTSPLRVHRRTHRPTRLPGEAPASLIEPGFSRIYNGRDFEGWGATHWRSTAKLSARNFPSEPADAVRRVNDLLVSNNVIGALETNDF
jgi:hypothetical protein